MVQPLRHRRTKGAETDMLGLTLSRATPRLYPFHTFQNGSPNWEKHAKTDFASLRLERSFLGRVRNRPNTRASFGASRVPLIGQLAKRLSSSFRMTEASTSTPVQYLMPRIPWLTIMPSPSSTRRPRASASRTSRVRGGWGMTSAMISDGRRLSTSRFRRPSISGRVR